MSKKDENSRAVIWAAVISAVASIIIKLIEKLL